MVPAEHGWLVDGCWVDHALALKPFSFVDASFQVMRAVYLVRMTSLTLVGALMAVGAGGAATVTHTGAETPTTVLPLSWDASTR